MSVIYMGYAQAEDGKTVEAIKVYNRYDIPENFTGFVKFVSATWKKETSEAAEWYRNGKLHRGDGRPAGFYPNAPDEKERYYINGKKVTQKAAAVYAMLFKENQDDTK